MGFIEKTWNAYPVHIFNSLNDAKVKKFQKIVNIYKQIDYNDDFDNVNASVIANLKYICEAFFFLVEYLGENDETEHSVKPSEKQQTLTVRKQVKHNLQQLTEDLPQSERKHIQQLIPTIAATVKRDLSKQKPSTPTDLRKRKLSRIQNEIAITVNDLKYKYDAFCLFKLIDIVVILYKYICNIENYINESQLFLNHDQLINVSASMKNKFNKIALPQQTSSRQETNKQSSTQKRQELVDNISRFLVTNLKQK